MLEIQRGRRDFIQWNVEASRLAMEALDAEGDIRGALGFATLRFGSACDLFYGDPVRGPHAYYFQKSAREVLPLAKLLGDEDTRARVRSRTLDAITLARVAHAGESLAKLEAVALQVGLSVDETDVGSTADQR